MTCIFQSSRKYQVLSKVKLVLECRVGNINSAFAIILMVIFGKTYIVQKVTCENSTTIIIKSCDSADKLFTQKILIKTVRILGQE